MSELTTARRARPTTRRTGQPLDHGARHPPAATRKTEPVLSCTPGRPLRLTTWLAVPFLFGSAVLGLIGLTGLLLGGPRDVTLASPLFGAAVAVGVGSSSAVTWRHDWQRVWLRWGYLTAWLATGVLLDGLHVPAAATTAVGLPVLAFLVAECVAERRRVADDPDEGMTHAGTC